MLVKRSGIVVPLVPRTLRDRNNGKRLSPTVRLDVDGMEPLIRVHHVIGLFTEKVRATGSFFGRQSHGG